MKRRIIKVEKKKESLSHFFACCWWILASIHLKSLTPPFVGSMDTKRKMVNDYVLFWPSRCPTRVYIKLKIYVDRKRVSLLGLEIPHKPLWAMFVGEAIPILLFQLLFSAISSHENIST